MEWRKWDGEMIGGERNIIESENANSEASCKMDLRQLHQMARGLFLFTGTREPTQQLRNDIFYSTVSVFASVVHLETSMA